MSKLLLLQGEEGDEQEGCGVEQRKQDVVGRGMLGHCSVFHNEWAVYHDINRLWV